ncbi:hypothetical protein AB7M17_003951 [Bradyrhizobium sp. USDA 377]
MPSLQLNDAGVYLTGRQLDRKIRCASTSELAAIADDLKSGRIIVTNFTEQQADRAVRFVAVAYDRQADRTIERLGAERVFAALDRATAPTTQRLH